MTDRPHLRDALLRAFRLGAGRRWEEGEFNRLALEVFRYQEQANPVYSRFVRGRGLDPANLLDWQDVPPVPVRAFQEMPENLVSPGPVEAVFRTSGTTRADRRGELRVRDLSLYRASLLATAAWYLRPELDAVEGGAPPPRRAIRVLALLPSPEELSDSSLCHMAGVLMDKWDDGSGGFFADASWSVRTEAWVRALVEASRGDAPVLVLATAFSLLEWLDRRSAPTLPPLPEGSLVMETGGYKGRIRSVAKGELYAAVEAAIGVPLHRVVSEYGMTEMLSQFYEAVLREGAAAPRAEPAPAHANSGVDRIPAPPRAFQGPPWVRTRVLDPVTLDDVSAGEPGLLCHMDLANLDSVSALLTEDEGMVVPGGFRVLGRLQGAEPRGCSLAVEELLTASEADSGGVR